MKKEQLVKAAGLALTIVSALAFYNFVVVPGINKLTTSAPAAAK